MSLIFAVAMGLGQPWGASIHVPDIQFTGRLRMPEPISAFEIFLPLIQLRRDGVCGFGPPDRRIFTVKDRSVSAYNSELQRCSSALNERQTFYIFEHPTVERNLEALRPRVTGHNGLKGYRVECPSDPFYPCCETSVGTSNYRHMGRWNRRLSVILKGNINVNYVSPVHNPTFFYGGGHANPSPKIIHHAFTRLLRQISGGICVSLGNRQSLVSIFGGFLCEARGFGGGERRPSGKNQADDERSKLKIGDTQSDPRKPVGLTGRLNRAPLGAKVSIILALGGLAVGLIGLGTRLAIFHRYWEARVSGWLIALCGIGLLLGTFEVVIATG